MSKLVHVLIDTGLLINVVTRSSCHARRCHPYNTIDGQKCDRGGWELQHAFAADCHSRYRDGTNGHAIAIAEIAWQGHTIEQRSTAKHALGWRR